MHPGCVYVMNYISAKLLTNEKNKNKQTNKQKKNKTKNFIASLF